MKLKPFVLTTGATLLLISSSMACAGIERDLNSLFKEMGGVSNVSGGGYYQSQQAGYLDGGSLFARLPARHSTIASYQMPNLEFSCSGINAFMGSWSHINSRELIATLRQIGSSALVFGFQIALQTVSPQIKQTIDAINKVMQEVNNMSINNCTAGAALTGAVWPQSEASSQVLCEYIAVSSGKVADYAAAKQYCGAEGNALKTNANRPKQLQDQLGDEYNLAWKAFEKNEMFDFSGNVFNFASEDQDLSELFMSISGTIVSRIENGRREIKHFESLLENDHLLDSFIRGSKDANAERKSEGTEKHGGNAYVYTCPDSKNCLKPVKKSVAIATDKAVLPRVEKLIMGMRYKVRNGGKISDPEKYFVNATNIPILKILALETAYMEGKEGVSLDEFSYQISYDIVLNYLQNVLTTLSAGLTNMAGVQVDETVIQKFIQDVRRVRDLIHRKRHTLLNQVNANLVIRSRINLIEKQMFGIFNSRHERY